MSSSHATEVTVLSEAKMHLSTLNTVIFSISSFSSLVAGASSCPPTLVARPTPIPSPFTHGRPHPVSPARIASKICYVNALGNGQDDSQTILSAAITCNNGGTIALLDAEYIIGKPLDLTFLDAVDFVIQGTVSFTPDIDFWVANSIKYTYQDASLFWQIGGRDVNLYGGGIINGNGQVWWDRFAVDPAVRRPMPLGIIGLKVNDSSHLSLLKCC